MVVPYISFAIRHFSWWSQRLFFFKVVPIKQKKRRIEATEERVKRGENRGRQK
jgi:hypothetical protein